MKKHVLIRMAAVVTMVVGMSAVGGCNSTPQEVNHLSVLLNMTPELDGVADTPAQRLNKIARSLDHTGREFWDDWDRLWLVDEPVKLNRYPIP